MHIEISNGGMWCFHFCSRFSAQDRSQVIHVSKSQHSDPERVVEALLHSYHVSRGRGRSGIQMEGWMRSHGRFGMGRGGMHRRSSRSSCRRCSCSSSRQTPRQQSTCLQPSYKPPPTHPPAVSNHHCHRHTSDRPHCMPCPTSHALEGICVSTLRTDGG